MTATITAATAPAAAEVIRRFTSGPKSVFGFGTGAHTEKTLARCGAPLSVNDIVVLRDGRRAALVLGPDGHRFLLEEVP